MHHSAVLTWAAEQGSTALSVEAVKWWCAKNGALDRNALQAGYDDGTICKLEHPSKGLILADLKALEGEVRTAAWLGGKAPRALRLGPALPGLTPSQVRAWNGLSAAGRAVLTGGPGTGKTKLLADLVKELSKFRSVTLMSPTGRASAHLSKVTGLRATTIHKGFGIVKGQTPQFNRYNPLPTDVLILDECSMIDSWMMGIILDGVSPHTVVFFVGDVDQIPPVEAGCPFADMVEYGMLPTFRLEEVMRQEGREIPALAKSINEGATRFQQSDRVIVLNGRKQEEVLIRWWNEYRGQIICPIRDSKRHCGTDAINQLIHDHNPTLGAPYGKTLRVGDRMVALENRYDRGYMNGHLGVVTDRGLRMENGVEVKLDPKTIESEFDYSYGLTVHKAQGGEYDDVLVYLSGSRCTRQLLYTAVTRAKKRLFLGGNLSLLLRGNYKDVRTTALPALVNQPDIIRDLLHKLDPLADLKAQADGVEW